MCSMHAESVLEKILTYAKQIVADVSRALVAIQAEELETLFNGDCLRDKYPMWYCDKKKKNSALSIRNYLRSLIDFLSFLIVEHIRCL